MKFGFLCYVPRIRFSHRKNICMAYRYLFQVVYPGVYSGCIVYKQTTHDTGAILVKGKVLKALTKDWSYWSPIQ